MELAVATSLLESIAADRLVVLCGAGLSMGSPSCLPSAGEVGRICRERYRQQLGSELEGALGDDIEAIARYFFAQKNFDSLFIGKLVPWPRFSAPPNIGHDALADFLACKALPAVVTTNFDLLCEQAAAHLGEADFRAIVDEADLPVTTEHGWLLKVHGCLTRSRPLTIWCGEQLQESPIRERIARFRIWLADKLLGKDLLVIGFWSDWAYLSELLASNLTGVGPRSVYVVNPGGADELQRKAPGLWEWAHGPHIEFHHVPESGNEFLDDLRRTWSTRFILRLMDASGPTYETIFGVAATVLPDLSNLHDSHMLYALRRDLTGTPTDRPVRDRTPRDSDHIAAAIHRRLLEKGATVEPHCFHFNGRSLRVISGRGMLLSIVRSVYQFEPPPLPAPGQVVCAGAVDDASSPDIVRGIGAGSIVRPGSTAEWTTHGPLLPLLQDADEQHH